MGKSTVYLVDKTAKKAHTLTGESSAVTYIMLDGVEVHHLLKTHGTHYEPDAIESTVERIFDRVMADTMENYYSEAVLCAWAEAHNGETIYI